MTGLMVVKCFENVIRHSSY